MRKLKLVAATLVILGVGALTGCGTNGGKTAQVDDARLLAANEDGANWMSYGRTYDEQRFSPLTDVNDTNVGQLGLEWSADMDTARGQEANNVC